MNVGIGRFQTMDSFEGRQQDPLSLHKYEFSANNPINNLDPGGHEYDIGSLTFTTAIVGILAAFPTVGYGNTGKTTEEAIILLIQDFNSASADTGIDVNVLGSLAWSESPSDSLGYWDRNTHNDPRAHGIMQLYDEDGKPNEYANLSDYQNIEEGAKILKSKVSDAKKFTHSLYGHNLTPDELNDPWFIPVALYKDSIGLSRAWENQIYSSWPNVDGTYVTKPLLRKLWKEYAN